MRTRVAYRSMLVAAFLLAGCAPAVQVEPEAPIASAPRVSQDTWVEPTVEEMPEPRTQEVAPAVDVSNDETAAALYARADLQPGELESLELPDPHTRDLTRYVTRIAESFRERAELARELEARFDPVIALRSPRWRIAALVRQGQIEEALAASMLRAVRPQRLPAGVPADVAAHVEEAVRPSLEPGVCRAIVRYSLAVLEARRRSIESREAEYAAARLESFPRERREACY